jgi:hypothetical protein
MAKEGEKRIIGVNGSEFTFERGEGIVAGRRIGDRKLTAIWVSPMRTTSGQMATATVNEFDDGILCGPSSIPGVFSDFAGAAAAEVQVRYLELANEHLMHRAKRQREIMMAVGGVVMAMAVVIISFLR